MKQLAGRTALVTGASGGIGRAISLMLANAGVDVVVSGRRTDALAELSDELRTKQVRTQAVPIDLTDKAAANSLIERTEREFGPIDILINNAGVGEAAAFTDLSPDEIRAMVEVNLTAAILVTRRVVPGMLDRGAGHVVFVSSGLGKIGAPYQAPYSATKAALIGFTQGLRAEYRHAPVGFSVVCPGLVTGAGMYQRMLDDGFAASPIMATTTTTRVARKIVAAIRHNRPEVCVTGGPIRPLMAAIQLNPRLAEVFMAASMDGLFRRRAASRTEANPAVSDTPPTEG